jgi:hypothetical protein
MLRSVGVMFADGRGAGSAGLRPESWTAGVIGMGGGGETCLRAPDFARPLDW